MLRGLGVPPELFVVGQDAQATEDRHFFETRFTFAAGFFLAGADFFADFFGPFVNVALSASHAATLRS